MADVFAKSSLKSGASLVALGLMLGSSAAFAGGLPHGGHYVAGHGTLNKATQSLTVKQSSIAGIIDWKGFSVGKHGSVTFDNGSGATLNRVTGGNLSRIAGTLHATGSLYLINSSGVIVSGTGRVVTGGSFIASSSTLSNSAFDSHERRFGDADAKVINRGSITSGGEAKLVGSSVANTGTITGAHVKLRATERDILAAGTIRAIGNPHHDAHILVISDTGETRIAGALIARNRDGSGGNIETSGRKLSIAGKIDAGKSGSWLVDPENLTVDSTAAETINKSLNKGTSVTLETTKGSTSGPGTSSAGPGDIKIESALSWNSDAELTLDAYRSVKIESSISITGAGGLAIATSDGGKLGAYSIGHGVSVDYGAIDNGGTLTIDGMAYALLYNMSELQKINGDLKGHYALATSLDASSIKHWKPLGTNGADNVLKDGNGFNGTFEGLGNTISSLTVHLHSDNYVGLFGFSSGTIRDIGVISGSIAGGYYVGGLVGENNGTVIDSSSKKDVVTSSGDEDVGGLVGLDLQSGHISHSYASGTVSGAESDMGGLVGENRGDIRNSHASVKVNGENISEAGGLVGDNFGSIANSYATGSISASNSAEIGGLVGENDGGIASSFATGRVESGYSVGGLVGANTENIENCYATGKVQGNNIYGGLVGYNSGSISQSYSVGVVSSDYQHFGGLVGDSSGSVQDGYWDTQTSGQEHSAGGKGLTTAQLTSGLPKGFNGEVWAVDPSINNGFPYLIALASSY